MVVRARRPRIADRVERAGAISGVVMLVLLLGLSVMRHVDPRFGECGDVTRFSGGWRLRPGSRLNARSPGSPWLRGERWPWRPDSRICQWGRRGSTSFPEELQSELLRMFSCTGRASCSAPAAHPRMAAFVIPLEPARLPLDRIAPFGQARSASSSEARCDSEGWATRR